MDTLHAFQLFLLTEMIRDADISLPSELNITNHELNAAKLQIESLGFMKPPNELKQYAGSWYTGSWYREVLGTPIHEQFDEATGLYSIRFRLPLWQTLDFVIHLKPDGSVWNKLGFSRGHDISRPQLVCANELKQWAFVKDEIELKFGPSLENDGWNAYEIARYSIPEHPEGATKKYWLYFSYDLLQKIKQEDRGFFDETDAT
jgi:hypothetical protein